MVSTFGSWDYAWIFCKSHFAHFKTQQYWNDLSRLVSYFASAESQSSPAFPATRTPEKITLKCQQSPKHLWQRHGNPSTGCVLLVPKGSFCVLWFSRTAPPPHSLIETKFSNFWTNNISLQKAKTVIQICTPTLLSPFSNADPYSD